MSRLPRAAVLVAVALALAVCTGCWGAPPVSPSLASTLPSNDQAQTAQVVLFGDSLSAWGKAPAVALWANEVPLTLSYNAEPGAEAANWMPWLAQVQPGQCVLYLEGTNEISRLDIGQATADTAAAFDQLADADLIVAYTLNTTSARQRGEPFATRAALFNTWLWQTLDSGAYPNLRVVDWNALSKGHPEYLTDDRIHHTDAGSDAYAAAIAQGGRLCAGRVG